MAFGGFTNDDNRDDSAKAPHILVVCTANRCRSPMGEALLQQAFASIGRTDVVVDSAGFMESGVPADPNSIAAVKELGLQISGHRSRELSRAIVESADLVLGMERAHVRQLAVKFKAFSKSFTVKEFERRARDEPPQRNEDFTDWVARLHVGRTTADLMGADPADDTADPIGQQLEKFQQTREELQLALTSIARSAPGY